MFDIAMPNNFYASKLGEMNVLAGQNTSTCEAVHHPIPNIRWNKIIKKKTI